MTIEVFIVTKPASHEVPPEDDEVEKAKRAYLSFTKQEWRASPGNTMQEFQRVVRFDSRAGELLFIPFEGG